MPRLSVLRASRGILPRVDGQTYLPISGMISHGPALEPVWLCVLWAPRAPDACATCPLVVRCLAQGRALFDRAWLVVSTCSLCGRTAVERRAGARNARPPIVGVGWQAEYGPSVEVVEEQQEVADGCPFAGDLRTVQSCGPMVMVRQVVACDQCVRRELRARAWLARRGVRLVNDSVYEDVLQAMDGPAAPRAWRSWS